MMEQYINKAAVVAEIERIKKEECPTDTYEGRCKLFWFEQFLSFLDTLEAKEVDEEYNGKAMLYVLEKGVKLGRRELIDKACEWLSQTDFCHYYNKEFIDAFRKAMEE